MALYFIEYFVTVESESEVKGSNIPQASTQFIVKKER